MTRSIASQRFTPSRRRRVFPPQAEGLEGRRLMSAGDLDLSFGSGGYSLTGTTSANVVQLQSDGKILAAGHTASNGVDFRLVRLTSTGALDSSFGSGGSVTADFAGRQDIAHRLAVLPSGGILVVGTAGDVEARVGKGNKVSYFDNWDFGLVQYLPNGTPDPSFGAGSKVTTNISTYSTTDSNNKRDEALALGVQDDGKIVVGGRAWTGANTTEAVLVRYNSDGTLDTSFGQGGVDRISMPNFNYNGVWDLAIERGDPTNPNDDKIVTMEVPDTPDASGNLHWSMQVARYNLDGTLDSTFGANGRTTTTMPGQVYAWAMAVQSDGSIVLGGDYDYQNGTPSDLMVARFTPSGTVDSTFGNGGIVLFNAGGAEYGRSVAVQPGDGKIVLAGHTGSSAALVARFNSTGAIDTSFGSGGVATNAFANLGSPLNSLALQPDGGIIAVGGAQTRIDSKTTKTEFLVARYQGDPVAPYSASMASTRGATSIIPSTETGQSGSTDSATNFGSGTDRVYQLDVARSLTSGSQSPSTRFALAAGNTNPRGIADPPTPTSNGPQPALVHGASHPFANRFARHQAKAQHLRAWNSTARTFPAAASRLRSHAQA